MLAEDGDLLEDDFDSCQCDHAGFCNVFLKDVSQELWMYCQENEEYKIHLKSSNRYQKENYPSTN